MTTFQTSDPERKIVSSFIVSNRSLMRPFVLGMMATEYEDEQTVKGDYIIDPDFVFAFEASGQFIEDPTKPSHEIIEHSMNARNAVRNGGALVVLYFNNTDQAVRCINHVDFFVELTHPEPTTDTVPSL